MLYRCLIVITLLSITGCTGLVQLQQCEDGRLFQTRAWGATAVNKVADPCETPPAPPPAVEVYPLEPASVTMNIVPFPDINPIDWETMRP